MSFFEQIKVTADQAEVVVLALSWILQNIASPTKSRRYRPISAMPSVIVPRYWLVLLTNVFTVSTGSFAGNLSLPYCDGYVEGVPHCSACQGA